MIKDRIPALAALTIEEKRELLHELWEEVESATADQPDSAVVALITERWKQFEAESTIAMTLEEFRKRLPPG